MTTKLKLEYPFEIKGETIEILEMRRSKVKDRLAISNMKNMNDEQKEIRLFANLCSVAPETIEELDENDYSELQKVYMGFFKSEGTLKEKS